MRLHRLDLTRLARALLWVGIDYALSQAVAQLPLAVLRLAGTAVLLVWQVVRSYRGR